MNCRIFNIISRYGLLSTPEKGMKRLEPLFKFLVTKLKLVQEVYIKDCSALTWIVSRYLVSPKCVFNCSLINLEFKYARCLWKFKTLKLEPTVCTSSDADDLSLGLQDQLPF